MSVSALLASSLSQACREMRCTEACIDLGTPPECCAPYLATVDRRIASKGAADRLGQRLRAIDDEQASHGWIESTLDEIIDERLHRRCVFGRALDEAERMFVAVRIDANRRDEEHIPSIWIASRSRSSSPVSSNGITILSTWKYMWY
jgi:hypothetical protein